MSEETCEECGLIITRQQKAYVVAGRILCPRCNSLNPQLAILTSIDKSLRFVRRFIILLIILAILGFLFNLITVGIKADDIEKAKAAGNYTDILTAEIRYNEAGRYAVRMIPLVGPGLAAMMEAGSNDNDLRHSIGLYNHMEQTIAASKASRGAD